MKTEKKQYVVFRLADEEYGADIIKVTVIERMMYITRVPKTPEYIKGVINLRGDIIPVMDLRARLGLTEKEEDDETRIIIFDINNVSFGAIVDSVSEVLQLEETKVESTAGIIKDKTKDFIYGVAKAESKLFTLLNLEKLISDLVPEMS
ncbi:MAG: chemotaxis protein CheW [Clostridiaceae bacterium]|nr:chemotaxis protein CheW [Clostridiaceae bacterium]